MNWPLLRAIFIFRLLLIIVIFTGLDDCVCFCSSSSLINRTRNRRDSNKIEVKIEIEIEIENYHLTEATKGPVLGDIEMGFCEIYDVDVDGDGDGVDFLIGSEGDIHYNLLQFRGERSKIKISLPPCFPDVLKFHILEYTFETISDILPFMKLNRYFRNRTKLYLNTLYLNIITNPYIKDTYLRQLESLEYRRRRKYILSIVPAQIKYATNLNTLTREQFFAKFLCDFLFIKNLEGENRVGSYRFNNPSELYMIAQLSKYLIVKMKRIHSNQSELSETLYWPVIRHLVCSTLVRSYASDHFKEKDFLPAIFTILTGNWTQDKGFIFRNYFNIKPTFFKLILFNVFTFPSHMGEMEPKIVNKMRWCLFMSNLKTFMLIRSLVLLPELLFAYSTILNPNFFISPKWSVFWISHLIISIILMWLLEIYPVRDFLAAYLH